MIHWFCLWGEYWPTCQLHWIAAISFLSRTTLENKMQSKQPCKDVQACTEHADAGKTRHAHICTLLMMVPKRPTMPRNSTLLRFFTVYSWHTLETAYKAALIRTRQSPIRMFAAAERSDASSLNDLCTLPRLNINVCSQQETLGRCGREALHSGESPALSWAEKHHRMIEWPLGSYWIPGPDRPAGRPPPWPPRQRDRCRRRRSAPARSESSKPTRTAASGLGWQSSPAAGERERLRCSGEANLSAPCGFKPHPLARWWWWCTGTPSPQRSWPPRPPGPAQRTSTRVSSESSEDCRPLWRKRQPRAWVCSFGWTTRTWVCLGDPPVLQSSVAV